MLSIVTGGRLAAACFTTSRIADENAFLVSIVNNNRSPGKLNRPSGAIGRARQSGSCTGLLVPTDAVVFTIAKFLGCPLLCSWGPIGKSQLTACHPSVCETFFPSHRRSRIQLGRTSTRFVMRLLGLRPMRDERG